jgi:hypothetical protein
MAARPNTRAPLSASAVQSAAIQKVTYHVSNKEWRDHAKVHGAMAMMAKITMLVSLASAWADIAPLPATNGAYADVISLCNFILGTALATKTLVFHSSYKLLWTVFIDGRHVWGSNLLWGISLKSTTTPDSASSMLPIIIVKGEKDTAGTYRILDAITHTGEKLRRILSTDVTIPFASLSDNPELPDGLSVAGVQAHQPTATSFKVKNDVVFTLDWVAGYKLVGNCKAANATKPTSRICLVCPFSGWDKLNWFLTPWRRRHRDGDNTWNHARCCNVQPSQVVYEGLHMMNCVTSHVFRSIVSSLRDLAPTFVDQFTSIIRVYRKEWDGDAQLEVCQTKKFWESDGEKAVLDALRSIPEEANMYVMIQLRENQLSQYVKLVDVVAMALASAKFSHTWTKTKTVTNQLFTDHENHALNLIAFLAKFKCQLNPSVHYWLDHAVEDVRLHGAPHFLCQEQGESKHAMHGLRKNTTCRGRIAAIDVHNSWECLMRHEFALVMLLSVSLPNVPLSSALTRVRQVF